MNPVKNMNYIQACRHEFDDLIRQKSGLPFNFIEIEKSVRGLRQKNCLTYADLKVFEAPDQWWFKDYWAFPAEDDVEAELERTAISFSTLPEHETQIIHNLLKALKSIEIVSIILRFVAPDDYGIISPPVERVLDVRRGSNAVETYLNYLGDLKAICREYVLDRIADADMALWVLHEKCFGSFQDAKVQRKYQNDPFLLRLRARNLVSPLKGVSDINLANALMEVKPELAELIACHKLELLIRDYAIARGILDPRLKFEQIINHLRDRFPELQHRARLWHALRDRRNKLFHHGKEVDERETLLGELQRLEEDLRKLKHH